MPVHPHRQQKQISLLLPPLFPPSLKHALSHTPSFLNRLLAAKHTNLHTKKKREVYFHIIIIFLFPPTNN